MADLQKKADGKGIAYPGTVPSSGDAVTDSQTEGTSLYLFLNGGVGADGKLYPKVDMSLWDQATMCGTCHVGGIAYEEDRNGNRLPFKALMDMATGDVNPFTTTVWENFTADGIESSFATLAPWVYPQYAGNNPANGPIMADPAHAWVTRDPFGNPVATGEVAMTMKDPNTGASMEVVSGQLMMPNVKEMDCFFCHLSGYDNVMSSVMTQAGSLNAAPAAGAGLFDMMPISPTYMGYNSQNGTVTFTDAGNGMEMVSLSAGMLNRIKGTPESNNCMQCHATKTLKDLPEMFGVTGNSSGFLSSAPMIYDPANGVGPLGKRMTSYDINAMWLFNGASPIIDGGNYMQYLMPGMPYLQAQQTFKNADSLTGFLGGGNPAQSGPLYYYNADGSMPDQNALKRSTMPFPRAEWFKRGDAWQAGQDIHGSFGCAGCHFTGDSTNKNQCDPGRGYDMSSTTQDGVPPLWKRQVVKGYDADGKPILAVGAEIGEQVLEHDTRNTVKRCEFCHITGKDYYGNPIQTYGAPNPEASHSQYGLSSNIVQIADEGTIEISAGGFGGQGVPEHTDFNNTKLGRGNHLDVMDCTVCHVQKKSMAVRALDATSGMRFPAIVGTDPAKGMVGLFEDPAPDSFNQAVVGKYNQMFGAINAYFGYTGGEAPGTPVAADSQACTDMKAGYGETFDCSTQQGPGFQAEVPATAHVMGGALKEWQPLHLWQRLGNIEAPLSFGNSDKSGLKYRRKIYLSNAISAIIWNNTDPTVDANGDTVNGGLLIGDNDHGLPVKPSLAGYTDVFDGLPPHENNTQGFDEPIYDPWIQRDLKAGMNFGPSALSVISVGFGNPMTADSGSAYDQYGLFSEKNYWKYASVWSGAVMFTEPEQISDYKAWRNQLESMKPEALQKDWTKTELAYIGAPFMVTHGVKAVREYVKGTSCNDCHAPGAGFFKGGFDMVGTAIPADRTFNPTSQISIDQATGTVTRKPGVPGLDSASNLMERPLEPVRVKALKGDLRTAFEGFNKLGQPRSVTFQKSDATHTWTTDLERADVLYPPHDGAIYYRIGDTNPDGSIKAGAVPMTGLEYADYMESISAADAAAMGVGVKPAPIAAVAGESGTTATRLTKGNGYALNAGGTLPAGSKFQWATNAGTSAAITDATAADTTVTFTKPGTFRVALTVTNVDGVSTTAYKLVNVANPVYVTLGTPATNAVVTNVAATATKPGYSYTTVTTKVPVALDASTPTFDKVRFFWGDGSASTTLTKAQFDTAMADGGQAHKYNRYTKYFRAATSKYTYKTTVQLFNGSTLVSSQSVIVEVP